MKKKLTLMLHAHMPYVIDSEVEYWLHEVVLHSYLPLIQIINNLQTSTPILTLNLSPILLVQLSTNHFKKKFDDYIQIRKQILSLDLHHKEKNDILKQDFEELLELENLFCFFDRDIIKAFQYLHQQHKVNIITSGATHAFFPPLINFPNILQAQISLGKAITEEFFPNIDGFWIPECAISPTIGQYLTENNIKYTFADPSSIKQHSHYISSYQDQTGLFYFCRDYACTAKIWDTNDGYPSNPIYREFHRDLNTESFEVQKILQQYQTPISGVSIYSITNKDNSDKSLYSHFLAKKQAQKDALDYIEFVQQQFNNKKHVTICFDAELFGHWWKDGATFLNYFLPLVQQSSIALGLPKLETENIYTPSLSTWGKNYNSESWINKKTQKIWEYLIYKSYKIESTLTTPSINHKELYKYLLQLGSDWSFLLTYDSFAELAKNMILDSSIHKNPNNILYKLITQKY